MAAPPFVQEAETAWNTATTPKTTASINVTSGNVLAVVGASEKDTVTISTPTNTGTGQTFSLLQSVVVSAFCWAGGWSATCSATEAETFSFARGATSGWFGGNVLEFSGSNGVGASSKNNGSGAPGTVSLTTTQANSAIVVIVADFNAGVGARTWLTNAGAFTEQTSQVVANYTVYAGFHADAGAVGSYTVGLSAPNQKFSIVAFEVKGTAGGGSPTVKQFAALGVG